MSNKTRVADLLKKSPGENVVACEGVVTFVGDVFAGNNKLGKPYSFQNLTITDTQDATAEFTVKLDGRPKVPVSVKGKVIQIVAKRDGNKLSGVVIQEVDDYRNKGQKKNVLKVTASASIIGIEGNHAADVPGQLPDSPAPAVGLKTPPQSPAHSTVSAPDATPPVGQPAKVVDDVAKSVKAVRAYAMRHAHAYFIASLAAEYVNRLHVEYCGDEMMPEQEHGCASTIYIQMNRDGVVHGLPANEILKYLPARPAPAAQRQQQ